MSESLPTFKEAVRLYRNHAGTDFIKPDKAKSYTRNDSMHLLDATGALIAVVLPGECIWGAAQGGTACD